MSLDGKVLQNRYSINEQIGAGGMGTVYLATDQRFGSTVAIKETLFTDPNLRRAFEREAQLLNGLRHPALPRVSDHFTEGNGAFIVMEYIPGEDLAVMVERDGAFAVADVLRWADALLDALDYLHNQKSPVIHRDIKPQNLKLTSRGEIILLDFGLAKGSASELSQVSIAKSVFGYSRSYAPLEQIQGTGTDVRSDLYSLAATVYHLLTGKLPIDALTRATAVLNGEADPLPSLNSLNPKILLAVSNVFQQAMALNANLRPATAAQMRFALTEAEKNPATVEFYDGTTILSNNAVPTDRIFTQNTQLLETRNTEQQTVSHTEGAAGEGENEPASTKILNSQNFTDPQNTLTTAPERLVTSISKPTPRPAARLPVAIAASVLLLMLGGAVLYSNGLLGFDHAVANNQLKQPSLLPESNAEEVTQKSPPVNLSQTDNANSLNQTPVAPLAANTSGKAESTIQAKSIEAAKSDDSGKNNQPRPSAPAAEAQNKVAAGDGQEFDELKDLEKELKDVEKDVNDALQEDKDKGNGFDGVPLDFRSNDPRNPVDREKLKIYIKKQRDAALQKVREANLLRAQKGLPPIPPRAPKVKIRRQLQNKKASLKN